MAVAKKGQGSKEARYLVKSELIEVVIPANTGGTPKTKIQLPDNPNLRETRLMGIETYPSEILPVSIVSRTPCVPYSLLRSIFLTLQGYNGKNFQWQDPLVDYVNIAAVVNWTEFPHTYVGQRVNYPKSYIEIADAALISTVVDQVVAFRIFYKEFPKVEKKDKKASFRNQS
jgi:hypothetical protein